MTRFRQRPVPGRLFFNGVTQSPGSQLVLPHMRRALLPAFLAYAISAHAQEAFNPRRYEQFKQKATCKALNRHGGEGVPDEVHIDISGFSSRTQTLPPPSWWQPEF